MCSFLIVCSERVQLSDRLQRSGFLCGETESELFVCKKRKGTLVEGQVEKQWDAAAAMARVQAPTSAGGWDYLRICCPQLKFMSCAATLGCSERGSRQPHAGSRIFFTLKS